MSGVNVRVILLLTTFLAAGAGTARGDRYVMKPEYMACRSDKDCGEINVSCIACSDRSAIALKKINEAKSEIEKYCSEWRATHPNFAICSNDRGLFHWVIPEAHATPAILKPVDHKCVRKLCALVPKEKSP